MRKYRLFQVEKEHVQRPRSKGFERSMTSKSFFFFFQIEIEKVYRRETMNNK